MKHIRYIRPTMPPPEEWLPYLEEAYEAKWYSNFGTVEQRLSTRLSERYGPSRRSVACASGTLGLTAALLSLGRTGSVVVPAFTFPATATAVQMAGCTPLICDVDPQTWELSPENVEPLLEAHDVVAVVPVRVFGFCRDLTPLCQLCSSNGVPVIVDSAAALGGRLPSGEFAGSQGEAEVFSLHATKVFGIGEGGVVMTTSERAAQIARIINFGLDGQICVAPGLNAKMSEFHAAIGLAVADRLDEFVRHRAHICRQYIDVVQGHGLEVPSNPGAPSWQAFPVLLPRGIDADEVARKLEYAGLSTRRYYSPALSDMPVFRSLCPTPPAVAQELASRVLCLPVYSDMSDAEFTEVRSILDRNLPALLRTPTDTEAPNLRRGSAR